MDNFTADERLAFVDEITLSYFNTPGSRPVGEALIEQRRESRRAMHENMHRFPQWFQESVENSLATQDLHEIQEHDRKLQLENRFREGDPELLKSILEDMVWTLDEISVLYEHATNENGMKIISSFLGEL